MSIVDWTNPTEGRNQAATVWIGGLEPQTTEELVWELMIQAGPVVNVHMPRDKISGIHQGYAFCEYETPEDADYCTRVLNMIKLFGKPLRINKAAADKSLNQDNTGWGANLFIGNLDPEVDEKLMYDTFSQFGAVLAVKIMLEDDGSSKGFGFVNFDSFESADAAIEAMNGQYICNRPVHVSYAYKKDGSKGDRHGGAAERLLAKQSEVKSLRPKPVPMAGFGGASGDMVGMNSMAMNPPPMPGMGRPLAPPGGPPPMPLSMMGGMPMMMGGMGMHPTGMGMMGGMGAQFGGPPPMMSQMGGVRVGPPVPQQFMQPPQPPQPPPMQQQNLPPPPMMPMGFTPQMMQQMGGGAPPMMMPPPPFPV